jgi:hypothetical protein
MGCVAVPSIGERSEPTFAIADLVLGSLADLDEAWLLDWYRDRA